MAATVRVGTCSWADEALVRAFYPKSVKTSEERLRYYAEHFSTVEVDSTFYRLPEEEMVRRWAERTPDGFVMHVKAFAMMTRHPVRLEQLPPDLRQEAPTDRGRVERPSRELRSEVFARFHDALAPLREAGKLGGILLQFPPYVVHKPISFDYLEWAAGQLRGDRALVEFRHSSWLDEDHRAETLAFLEERGLAHVVTDAPRIPGARNVPPTVVAVTAPIAYVRFHGRNAATWNKRGGSASERFDYLYAEEELREWVEPLRELAGEAEEAYAFFNNNARSPSPDPGGGEVAQSATNAAMLQQILTAAGVPLG